MAMNRGPITGVTGTLSYFRMTLSKGWDRRVRAAVFGSRILVDGLIEALKEHVCSVLSSGYRMSVFTFSSVSASFAGLSHLILLIRGKRSAIPDLCLELK